LPRFGSPVPLHAGGRNDSTSRQAHSPISGGTGSAHEKRQMSIAPDFSNRTARRMVRSPLQTCTGFLVAGAVSCSAPVADPAGEQAQESAPRDAPVRTSSNGLALSPQRYLVPGREDLYRVISQGAPIPEDLVWSSSDPRVARIRPMDNARALLTGLREGRTVIAAYSNADPNIRAEYDLWVGPPTPFPPIPPQDTLLGGLRVRAESFVQADTSGGSPGAQLLRASVTFTNQGPPQVLRFGRCGLWLTGHMGGNHWGEEIHVHPPMWDQRRLECRADAPQMVSLGQEESLRITTRVYAHEILGDSLDSRDHHLHAHVPVNDNVLVLNAGAQVLRFAIEQFRARASIGIEQGSEMDTLHARAWLINELDVPVRLEYGACALRLRAYRTPQRTGKPAWRSEWRAPANGMYSYGCPGYLAIGHIPGGGEFSPREFEIRVPLAEILSDSLPNGRYFFTAVLEAAGDTFRVPAGDGVLELEREPLPARRVREGVTYWVDMEIVQAVPVAVRARVAFARDPRGSSLRRISIDCPVVLHAYRSRIQRDAAPRSGAADWRAPRSCGPGEREIVLRGATPHVFDVSATAAEILGDSLPPGRYSFAVSVHPGGSPIFLAAGEAELRK
jgi:hypothetical protein